MKIKVYDKELNQYLPEDIEIWMLGFDGNIYFAKDSNQFGVTYTTYERMPNDRGRFLMEIEY